MTLIASATNPELIDALNSHLSDTLEQSSRLEDIFHLMKEEPEAKRCDGMETLIDEAHSIDEENEVIRDEALLLAVQRIEHFEIVSYRALMRLAKKIRWREIYEILGVSLREELEAERWLRNLTKRDSLVKEFNPEAY